MAHDVFISYASSDQQVAETVCQLLEGRGIRCWFASRDIQPGVAFGEAIVEAIRASRVFVLVFSSNANVSDQVRREVELAVQVGAVVVPVRIEDVPPSRAFQYQLSTSSWLDAFTPPLERHIGRLATRIESILLRDSASSAGASEASAPTAAPAHFDTKPRSGWWSALGAALSRFGASRGVGAGTVGNLALSQPENAGAVLAAEVVDQLSVTRLEDLAGFHVPTTLQKAIGTIAADLPGSLDQVARQVEQTLSLQDPGRRIVAIEAALRIVSSILSSLFDQSTPVAAAIARVATGWAAILTAERDAAQAALDDAREIENPFIVGNPVHTRDQGLFTGRRDLVLEIERNILRAAQTPTLLLYGQRRMGKTSILNQLPTLLGPGFLPVLVDCQAPAVAESPPALLRYLSRCLSAALNTRLGIVHDDEATRRARGGLPLPLDALREDAFSVFEDWLDEFQTRVPTDTHLLLCLDEFERLQETVAAGWGTRFLDGLRHWLQHRPHFALMFIGSHTFEQLGSVWTDRFLSAQRLKVSFLGEADVRQLLTRPTPTFRLAYAPGALEAILLATHGQPFLTQVLASELVHHMNRAHRKEATTDDVDAAIEETLERSAEYFADLWSSRSDAEREVLCEAARGRTRPPVTPVTRALRDYDVLDDSGQFAVPLVRRWVEQKLVQIGIASD